MCLLSHTHKLTNKTTILSAWCERRANKQSKRARRKQKIKAQTLNALFPQRAQCLSACVIAALARLSNGLFFCLYVVCTSAAAASNRCVRRIWAREYMMLSELHQRRALRENRRPISVGFLLCDGGALAICSTAVNRVGGQR